MQTSVNYKKRENKKGSFHIFFLYGMLFSLLRIGKHVVFVKTVEHPV